MPAPHIVKIGKYKNIETLLHCIIFLYFYFFTCQLLCRNNVKSKWIMHDSTVLRSDYHRHTRKEKIKYAFVSCVLFILLPVCRMSGAGLRLATYPVSYSYMVI